MPTPTAFPTTRRAILLGRESSAGTVATTLTSVPCEKFQPSNKIMGLEDRSLRQSMAGLYGLIQGPYNGEVEIGGPIYADTIGHLLFNILGDYTATGTAATPNTTLSGSSNTAGATSLTVAAGASFTNGMWIQVGTGTSAEIVQASGAGSSGSIPIANTPLRFNHSAAEAVTNTSAPYTHVFSLLNSAANGAQPPTLTFVDDTGIPATYGARNYAYSCLSDLTITGDATQLLKYDGKATTFLGTIATAVPTFAPSTQPAQGAWNSVVGIGGPASGGTLINYADTWELGLQRKLEVYFTAQGSQQPYAIVRGELTATLKVTFGPVPSEAQLLNFLNWTQPQTQFVATGPNSTSLKIDAQQTAYDDDKLNDGKVAFGDDVTAKLVANTTNVGNSAGYSPVKITLTNAVPSY